MLKDMVETELHLRVCSVCGLEMNQGYCIDSGKEYYCSDECLHKIHTEEEWLEMYGEYNYWTEWDD